MIHVEIKVNQDIIEWMKKGVPRNVKNALVRSAKETGRSTIAESVRSIRDSRFYSPTPKIAHLKKQVFLNLGFYQSSGFNDAFNFNIKYSRKRVNLYRVPFKMRQVTIQRKTPTGGIGAQRINQILKSEYGRPFEVDEFKPFFTIGKAGNSGFSKYYIKGTPKKSEKPIALYRASDSKLDSARAHSVSDVVGKTTMIVKLNDHAQKFWDKSFSRNYDFYMKG